MVKQKWDAVTSHAAYSKFYCTVGKIQILYVLIALLASKLKANHQISDESPGPVLSAFKNSTTVCGRKKCAHLYVSFGIVVFILNISILAETSLLTQ